QAHEGVDAIRQALVQQLYQPVQWTGCVQALAAKGISRVAECGPGKVVTGLVKRIDKNIEWRPLATPADFAGALEEWASCFNRPGVCSTPRPVAARRRARQTQ